MGSVCTELHCVCAYECGYMLKIAVLLEGNGGMGTGGQPKCAPPRDAESLRLERARSLALSIFALCLEPPFLFTTLLPG